MTQDVRQWLTEIKSLQQKLAVLQQERDEAYASAANWRNLYETEAKQRRTDAALAQQSIDFLNAEMQQMRELPEAGGEAATVSFIQQEVNEIEGIEALRSALVRALTECDRLSHALKSEQAAHSQTRKALTTTLGDTIDLLAKERATRKQSSKQSSKQNNKQNGHKPLMHIVPAAPTANNANNASANNPVNNNTVNSGASASRKADLKTPSLELPQLE